MAPKKASKPAAAPESGTPEAAPKAKLAKPRTPKVVAVPEPAPIPPPPAAEGAPVLPATPAAPRGRKPRVPKAAAAPEPETAVEAAAPEAVPEVEAAPATVTPPTLAAAELLSAQASAVLEAIHDGRAVELLFADAETNPPRTFEPRQLIYDTFAKSWYVWGWDRRYNAERHHRLDLIAQVGPVEGMGRAAQGPYKDGTPANLIGGWLGGEPIHVKAVLLKQWIFAVRQAPAPFPNFKMEDLEEGKAQVTFTGTDLRAISRWAMQFGDGIQVLEPQRLQDRIKQVGIAWGGKAAAERPAPAPQAAPAPRPQQAPRPQRQERQDRQEHGHKPEHRAEHRAEHRILDPSDPSPTERRPRIEAPRFREEAPKPTAKPGKIEIRFDRL